MSQEVTITLPAIDETVIAHIDTLATQASATEVDALKAIREQYAALARQNGNVKIGWTYRGDGANWAEEKDYYYTRDGRRVKAFLCVDNFDKEHHDQNRGRNIGDRLYLTQTGAWLRIERDGYWSHWQGEARGWACGPAVIDHGDDYGSANTGSIRILTDDQVAAEYALSDIVSGLAASLSTLVKKLPERMTRVKQRAEIASQLLAALTNQN